MITRKSGAIMLAVATGTTISSLAISIRPVIFLDVYVRFPNPGMILRCFVDYNTSLNVITPFIT
jgi:hypothetical protein